VSKLEQAARQVDKTAMRVEQDCEEALGEDGMVMVVPLDAYNDMMEAITALREALADPQITTPDVCGEVCVRAKLCYGCNKDIEEANASWMSHDELNAYWSGYGNGKRKALSESVAFKFPRETKPEQSMGWTIDYGLIRQIAEDIGDQEFIPSHEGIELVLLSLEGIYAAPVQQAEQEPVIRATLAPPAPPEVYQMRSKDAYEAGWWEAQRQKAVSPIAPAQQAEQEPVAWMWACTECGTEAEDGTDCRICSSCGYHKFYKAPKVATCVCAAKTQEKVKQEPVGEVDIHMDFLRINWKDGRHPPKGTKLYTAPVKPVKQEPFMCEPVPPISEDGWTDWVCPKPQGYLMQCCDCGLIHEVDSRVVKYEPMPSEEFEVVENPNMQCQWRVRRRDDLRKSNVKV
jgi:hypothetical protein